MNLNSVQLIKGFPDFNTPGFDIEKYNRQFREKNSVIWAKSRRIYYDRHWGGLSLKLAPKGNEYYKTSHSFYEVNNSNFLILNKDTEYSSFIDSETEVESFTLNISEKYTKSFIGNILAKPENVLENRTAKYEQQVVFIERIYKKDQLVFPLLSTIYNRLDNFEERSDEIIEAFSKLMFALLRLNQKVSRQIEAIGKTKHSTKKELYKRLHYARDFIDACHIDPEINLDNISSIACLNREYFIRQFRLLFRITPAQYIIKKRMETARDILLKAEIPVSEVCRRTGYSDPASFGKLFRKYYKMSPAQLKRSSYSTRKIYPASIGSTSYTGLNK